MGAMPRRRALLAGLAVLARPAAATGRVWRFDQAVGRIGFTARHFGLFSSTGRFERFRAMVALDPADPTHAEVAAVVETSAISHPWPAAGPLLRSAAFFDSERFPEARFTGRASGVAAGAAFPLAGTLAVRGIERPFRMEARLAGRGFDAAAGGEVADFSAEGVLDRTAFGMVAEREAIADEIGLSVRVRLLL
jgi:polyisoprenoid-binding protein YceI